MLCYLVHFLPAGQLGARERDDVEVRQEQRVFSPCVVCDALFVAMEFLAVVFDADTRIGPHDIGFETWRPGDFPCPCSKGDYRVEHGAAQAVASTHAR